jgi:dethiobiotin synthetase
VSVALGGCAGVFVTGTDTGVGKTEVGCLLLRAAVRSGMRAACMKVAETGCSDGEGSEDDRSRLVGACERALPPKLTGPYRYREPIAPRHATELAGRVFDLAAVSAGAVQLAAFSDLLLVEGAGGLLCPFPGGLDGADVARALGLPLLVVGRAGLGTVNHVLLTLREAERRGLLVAGVVLNKTTADGDPSEAGNARLIEEGTSVPILGVLPWGASAPEGELLLERVARRLSELTATSRFT